VSSERPAERTVVGVFAKAPQPGAVKTRLAGFLGAEGAAELHARLATHAVETALASRVGPVKLWCAPDIAHPFFTALQRRLGVELVAQHGADLGERMENAFASSFASGRRMVLVGADCPSLEPGDLRDAATALDTHDAAFAPAEDGGYVLIALAKALPVFAEMPWSTPQVMSRTRERLRSAGARWTELRTLWDVDRPEDLARLQQAGLVPGLA
jgi:rSAM/selenodomain-associated transferase 1